MLYQRKSYRVIFNIVCKISLIVIWLLIGVVVAMSLFRISGVLIPSHPNVDEVMHLTGLSIPNKKRLVNSYRNGINGELFAQIRMNAYEVDNWIKTLPNGTRISYKERLDPISDREGPDWWKPGKPKRFVSFYASVPRKGRTYGLISRQNGKLAMIFLYQPN